MDKPDLDLFDTIGYWVFRAALLIVFIVWLVHHVIHEVKLLISW